MESKIKIAVSAVGIMFFVGAFCCGITTLQLINLTWSMAVSQGFMAVIGYILATGAASAALVVVIVLFCVVGAVLTFSPWSEKSTT